MKNSGSEKNKKVIPKKSLGQNFLAAGNLAEKIVAACSISPEDIVLEIGPGKGVLTRLLAQKAGQIIAVEKDSRLIDSLRAEFTDRPVTVQEHDILKFPLNTFEKKIKVVGNLPYYISTPILEHLLEYRKNISEIYITVQHEFARRLTASPGTKNYGSLSCFVQYYCETTHLFKIKNTAFTPKPKVDSAFVRLRVRPRPAVKVKNEEFFFTGIREAFQQRRKTLPNALQKLAEKEKVQKILENMGVGANIRAEKLSLTQFATLFNEIS